MTSILVVDDSAVDRKIVGGLLEQRPDYQEFYAEDGTDALLNMERWNTVPPAMSPKSSSRKN